MVAETPLSGMAQNHNYSHRARATESQFSHPQGFITAFNASRISRIRMNVFDQYAGRWK
jgi:hypothetical protein